MFKVFKRLYNYLKNLRYSDNKIYIISASGKKKIHPTYLPYKGYNIFFKGNNNIVVIHKSDLLINQNVNINFLSNNNLAEFGKNISGNWSICFYEKNGNLKIGNNTAACDIRISIIGNELYIGEDCMFSNSIVYWADGHSVIDNESGEIINIPKKPTVIGNHVWLGERVVITKNAVIPDNCIVGIASVVTKEFKESNCLIAGNPAEIKKRNINWDGPPPV